MRCTSLRSAGLGGGWAGAVLNGCLGNKQQSRNAFVTGPFVTLFIGGQLRSTCLEPFITCFRPCLLAHQRCVRVPSDTKKTLVHHIVSAEHWVLCWHNLLRLPAARQQAVAHTHVRT